MNKRETLEKEYRIKKRNYEDKRDELLRKRNQSIAIIEENIDRSRYYLKDYVLDQDILTQGLRKLDHMIEDVLEESKVDLKEHSREVEVFEENYSYQLHKINEKR